MPSRSEQLELLPLLEAGAAQLLADTPGLAACPEALARLRRVLGARAPCRGVIRWLCPRCGARSRSELRCGPGCPACARRRGPGAAAMLRQLPQVPVRHWVLTLPRPQRRDFAGDPALEGQLARAFVQAIFERLRARCGAPGAACGAIVVVHRCGSALDLGLHLHAIVVDGVFVRDERGPRFVAAAAAGEAAADLEPVLQDMTSTLARCPGPAAPPPALAAIRAAAGTRRATARSRGEGVRREVGAARASGGLRVYCGEAIAAEDRGALRRLCEYLARPPAARLVVAAATPQAVTLRLPPQPDGATQARLSARELTARLIAATPAGPAISTRSYGALAPRAAHLWRQRDPQLRLLDVDVEAPPRAAARPRPGRARERPRGPRCRRCDAPLQAIEVEEAADAPLPGGPAAALGADR